MHRWIGTALAAAIGLGSASAAHAGNYIIHLQGRGWGSWNDETVNVSQLPGGWSNVTVCYNGSARLNGPETNSKVKGAIATYCTGTNSCVLHCYSAGCLRMLKAVSDLRAEGNSLPGLLWAVGSGSAAGGSHLAEISTTGLTGFIAKLFGQQEPIDFDLTPGAARNTWGYIQNDMGKTVYHVAGRKDTCINLLGLKLCGNPVLNAGAADGLVGFDSAGGFSDTTRRYDGCPGGDAWANKYPYRTWAKTWDVDENPSDGIYCDGWYRDHGGMPGIGVSVIAANIMSSSTFNSSWQTDQNRTWSDSPLNSSACVDSSGQCDYAFNNTSRDFSRTPAGYQYATDVSSVTSNTTNNTGGNGSCYGHCGGEAKGGTCWCDLYCVTAGDCCSDYNAAQCPTFNSARIGLYRAYKSGADHLFTVRKEEPAQLGYSLEGGGNVQFWLYDTNIATGTYLFRCNLSNGLHSYQNGISQTGSYCPSGATQELLGVIAPTSWNDGSVSLYRMWKGSDWVLTISATEKNNLAASGWSYDIPGYVQPTDVALWCQ